MTTGRFPKPPASGRWVGHPFLERGPSAAHPHPGIIPVHDCPPSSVQASPCPQQSPRASPWAAPAVLKRPHWIIFLSPAVSGSGGLLPWGFLSIWFFIVHYLVFLSISASLPDPKLFFPPSSEPQSPPVSASWFLFPFFLSCTKLFPLSAFSPPLPTVACTYTLLCVSCVSLVCVCLSLCLSPPVFPSLGHLPTPQPPHAPDGDLTCKHLKPVGTRQRLRVYGSWRCRISAPAIGCHVLGKFAEMISKDHRLPPFFTLNKSRPLTLG